MKTRLQSVAEEKYGSFVIISVLEKKLLCNFILLRMNSIANVIDFYLFWKMQCCTIQLKLGMRPAL